MTVSLTHDWRVPTCTTAFCLRLGESRRGLPFTCGARWVSVAGRLSAIRAACAVIWSCILRPVQLFVSRAAPPATTRAGPSQQTPREKTAQYGGSRARPPDRPPAVTGATAGSSSDGGRHRSVHRAHSVRPMEIHFEWMFVEDFESVVIAS